MNEPTHLYRGRAKDWSKYIPLRLCALCNTKISPTDQLVACDYKDFTITYHAVPCFNEVRSKK